MAQARFEQVEFVSDVTPARAILRLQATYGLYQIFIRELFSDGLRKYSYYILRDDRVTAGFDNSPDPRAIRLKYGSIGKEHVGEPVPHLHLENKAQMSLTEDMVFSAFIDWLEQNLSGLP